MLQVAVCVPYASLIKAVIIALPCFNPINTPSSVTRHTFVLLLDHCTSFVVASSGLTIGANICVSFASIVTSF